MRELHGHKVNNANNQLQIVVLDEPGQGGANHYYGIYGFYTEKNASADDTTNDETCLKILFQNGPIGEVGVNGVTQEALLEIVVDRLKGFQKGPFSSKENAVALTHVETALLWLQKRTLDRMARGVEGKNIV